MKEYFIKKYVEISNKFNEFINKGQNLCAEVENTKFTKKIPQKIAIFCSTMLVSLMPTIVFAANPGTDVIDNFVTFLCEWLKKIGALVMLIGGIMFALGWQRNDSESKTNGLQTLLGGGMVVAFAFAPDIFGL